MMGPTPLQGFNPGHQPETAENTSSPGREALNEIGKEIAELDTPSKGTKLIEQMEGAPLRQSTLTEAWATRTETTPRFGHPDWGPGNDTPPRTPFHWGPEALQVRRDLCPLANPPEEEEEVFQTLETVEEKEEATEWLRIFNFAERFTANNHLSE